MLQLAWRSVIWQLFTMEIFVYVKLRTVKDTNDEKERFPYAVRLWPS